MELNGRPAAPSKVTVISPHLDDGVLSLGAAIAEWSSSGTEVSIVTVLAGNPDSRLPARPWDAESGFRTAGEASRARREEDSSACAIVGATSVWLPFGEARGNPGVEDATIRSAIVEAVADSDTVLVPGFPLAHPEHEWLARLMLEHGRLATRVGLYVEQPYAYGKVVGWRLASARSLVRLGKTAVRTRPARAHQEPRLPDWLLPRVPGSSVWIPLPAGARARRAKRRALEAYPTQLPRLGRWIPARIHIYERCWGGEGVLWLPQP